MSALRKTTSCLFLIGVTACSTTKPPGAPHGLAAVRAKIEAAAGSASVAGNITSPSGKLYAYWKTTDAGAQAEGALARRQQFDLILSNSDVSFDDSNVFKGKARAEAKTTLAHAKLEKFNSLDGLVTTIPADNDMLTYDPKITRDTPRVKEEIRNVGVCAWIVATKREEDNDYHIMLSNGDGSIIFNAEMSGIPNTGTKVNRKRIHDARAGFESFIGENGRSTGNYTGWGDAVPVYVEGSLFYDTEHAPGKVGPAFARPASAWEIHPIADIRFEPGDSICPK
jgi:hypothetical protein